LAEESSTHQTLRISTKLELECGVSNSESCDLAPKDGRDIVDIWQESSEKSILTCRKVKWGRNKHNCILKIFLTSYAPLHRKRHESRRFW
jgi:hypothetical protein